MSPGIGWLSGIADKGAVVCVEAVCVKALCKAVCAALWDWGARIIAAAAAMKCAERDVCELRLLCELRLYAGVTVNTWMRTMICGL